MRRNAGGEVSKQLARSTLRLLMRRTTRHLTASRDDKTAGEAV
jgi:hypothetical protein